jgi:hypothetical protein
VAGRMSADAADDVSEVSEGIDIQALARGGETGQDGCRPTTVVASEKHPVLAADSNTAETPLQTPRYQGRPQNSLSACRPSFDWTGLPPAKRR